MQGAENKKLEGVSLRTEPLGVLERFETGGHGLM